MTIHAHTCPITQEQFEERGCKLFEPVVVTCGNCERSWCERCDPCPSAMCPWCNGAGGSSAVIDDREHEHKMYGVTRHGVTGEQCHYCPLFVAKETDEPHVIEATVKVYLTLGEDGEWFVASSSTDGYQLDGDVYCSESCNEHKDNYANVAALPDVWELAAMIDEAAL